MFTAKNTSDSVSPASENVIDKESLGKAIGRIASGVYIVTLCQGTTRMGLLATWIAQAAFEPPMLTIAINNQRPILEFVTPGTVFTINVLSNKNMDIFKAFAKPAQAALDDRFDGLDLKNDVEGGPVFSAAVAYLNCRVVSIVAAGDHTVLLAEVLSGEALNIEAEPMIHLRKNGFQY